jgi:hypothetical protein
VLREIYWLALLNGRRKKAVTVKEVMNSIYDNQTEVTARSSWIVRYFANHSWMNAITKSRGTFHDCRRSLSFLHIELEAIFDDVGDR